MSIATYVEFGISWLGSLISCIDFFMRNICSGINNLRAVNSVSNGTLSCQVVGAESLFSISMSSVGVLKVTVIGM